MPTMTARTGPTWPAGPVLTVVGSLVPAWSRVVGGIMRLCRAEVGSKRNLVRRNAQHPLIHLMVP